MFSKVITLRALLRIHPQWQFRWIPREGNYLAHNLARWGLQNVNQFDLMAEDFPLNIVNCDESTAEFHLWVNIMLRRKKEKKKSVLQRGL